MLHIVGAPEGAYTFLCLATHNLTRERLLVYKEHQTNSFRALPLSLDDVFDASSLPLNRRFAFEGAADVALPQAKATPPADAVTTALRQIESLTSAAGDKHFAQKIALVQIRGLVQVALTTYAKKKRSKS